MVVLFLILYVRETKEGQKEHFKGLCHILPHPPSSGQRPSALIGRIRPGSTLIGRELTARERLF